MIENLLIRLKELGIDIKVKDENLAVNLPKGFGDKAILEEIRQNKKAILEFLSSKQHKTSDRIERVEDKETYQVSSAQKRMFLTYTINTESIAYNVPQILRLKGNLDKSRLLDSINKLIAHHEGLRTRFSIENGNPVQKIIPGEKVFFESYKATEEDIKNVVEKFIRPFNLEKDLLFRAGLIELSEEEHILMLDMHHIVIDGVSQGILVKDLMHIYQGEDLKAPQIRYRDFSEWQHSEVHLNKKNVQRTFWLDKFKEDYEMLNLPSDFSVNNLKTREADEYTEVLDEEITMKLHNLAKKQGTTMFMLLFSAYNVLLSKLANQEDIIVGIPTAGRLHDDLKPVVGMFANTLPLRNEIKGSTRFTDLLKHITEDTLSCFDHQAYQFDDLLEDLNIEREPNRNPLFNLMFTLQNFDLQKLELPGLSVEPLTDIKRTSIFDIILRISEYDNKTFANFEYAKELFRKESVEKFAVYFKRVIVQIITNPQISVSDIQLLSDKEIDFLKVGYNDNATDFSKEKSIAQIFTAQVSKNPDAIAIRSENEQFSYAELDALSNQLAHKILNRYNLKTGEAVGMFFEKGTPMIISILGILKAGGAYVPIDPNNPVDRNTYIARDSGIKLVLTQSDLESSINFFDGNRLCVDDALDLSDLSYGPVESKATSNDLAYIIYTSGSTGKPKGTLIPQYSVSRVVKNTNYIELSKEDKIIQLSNYAFDGSVFDIFGALLNGGTLCIPPSAILSDIDALSNYIEESGITAMFITAALFNAIIDTNPEKFKGVRKIISGGEKMSVTHAAKALEVLGKDVLINGYGPTESTVFALCYPVNDTTTYSGGIPIGKPVSNTEIYVLDKDLNPAPDGVIAELYIAGDGLSKGYLNNEELTKEKFVDHPFKEGAKIYRTGDLVYRISDGNIVFAGRTDHQIKLRGFRIELDEIEKQLQQFNEIDQSLVVHAEVNGSKCLIAYYKSESEIEEAHLRDYLGKILPDYMIPSYFKWLAEFPLTNNGKIARRQLPLPENDQADTYVARKTAEEKLLAEVWSAVLGLEKVGVEDNFFNVGGDSIKAIQICSRVRNNGYLLTVENIFKQQKISKIAEKLEKLNEQIDQSEVIGKVALSPIQYWFLNGPVQNKNHFNQSVMLEFVNGISIEKIRAVFEKLIAHHDALRMVYKETEEGYEQNNQPVSEKSLHIEEYTITNSGQLLDYANALQKSIDIKNGPLVKLGLYHLNDSSSHLLIAIHHLVIDGVSWRILFEDIDVLLKQYQNSETLTLQDKTDSYRKWNKDLSQYIETANYKTGIDYWQNELAQKVQGIEKDYPDGSNTYGDFQKVDFSLDAQYTNYLLKDSHKAFGTQINDLLLSALYLSIHKFYGIYAIKLDLEGHGREVLNKNMNTNRTVGWFTNLYPVVLSAKTTNPEVLIRQIKDKLRSVPNGGMDYLLGIQNKDLNTNSWSSQISFNYLGQFDTDTVNREFSISRQDKGFENANTSCRVNEIEFSGMVSGGCLHMVVGFSNKQYSSERMQDFMDCFKEELQKLVTYCREFKKPLLSLSDLTNPTIPLNTLDALQEKYALEDVYPLSAMQEGMLFHSLMDKTSDNYFDQMSCRVYGEINLQAVEQSMNALLERYSVLRTNFIHENLEKPVQIVHKQRNVDYRFIDISNELKEGEALDTLLEVYRAKDRADKFDLSNDVLMRFTVLKINETTFEFIWSFHHILMDGWCVSIIINEFGAYYKSFAQGIKANLPEVKPYSDYMRWLLKRDSVASKLFWKSYLEGFDKQTSLPKSTSAVLEVPNKRFELVLNAEETEILNKASRNYNVTLNTVFQAAWGVLLSRYNAINDVVFGSVVSGRPAEIEGIEKMVGLFINTVPVRIEFEGSTLISEMLTGIQETVLSGEPYHYESLSTIQGESNLGKDLLDHIMIFENYPIADEIKNEDSKHKNDLTIGKVEMFEKTNYPLTIVVLPGEEIHVQFDFNPSVYSDALIEKVARQLKYLLSQIACKAATSVSELSLLEEGQVQYMLNAFNDTETVISEKDTVISLIESNALKSPDTVALTIKNETVTYEQLWNETLQVASYLVGEYAIEKGSVVGVYLERERYFIPVILGILKAGACYIPMDTSYPADRVKDIIADSAMQCLVTRNEYLDNIEIGGVNTLNLSENIGKIFSYEKEVSFKPVDQNDLAYIIYTSGSTGKPKGVMIEHKSLLNYINWASGVYVKGEKATFPLYSSISFDLTVTSIFTPLITGNQIVVYQDTNGLVIEDIVKNENIDIIKLTPSHLEVINGIEGLMVNKKLPPKKFIVGGEQLRKDVAQAIYNKFNSHVEIYNEYGPTEATVGCMIYQFNTNDELFAVPIGTPAANTKIYILDSGLNPVPFNVPGEMYIAGHGLARGYVNQESLTAARFITNPYSPRERLYKTGDLAYRLEDGRIVYLGRIDHQVQLRGFRIELGEIEGRVQGYHGITQSYVLLREVSGNASLVCYYTSSGEVSGEALREYLHTVLPDYMVPGYYVSVDSFPLTSNGKLDRNSLPLPESGIEGLYRAPRNEVEELLAGVWCGVLGVDRIGIDDNFFSIGGDSIKSIQISSRMRSHGYDVTVKELFNNPTIASLSVDLRKLTRSISQEAVVGRFDLSPIQQWFISGPVTCKDHFNQSVMLEFTNGISKEAVKGLFEVLLAHHDALRLVYREGEQESMAVGSHSLQIDERDVTDASGLSSYANALQSSFSLTEGPLVKLGLYQMTGGSSHLLISMHHWVIDAVSWRILFEDLGTLYAQYSEGSPLKLPLKTDSYRTWISSLKTYSQGSVYQENLAYWKALLEGTYNWIPVNDVTGANTYQDVKSAQFTLSEGHTGLLLRDSQHAFGTQINDLLLAALMDSFHSVYGMESLCLDLESHGREDIGDVNISRTVGWFTTLYPVVLGYEEDLSRLVRGVKECLRSVPHGGIDYLLGISRGDLYPAGSRLLFNYLGQFDSDSRSDFYGMSAADRGMEVKLSSEREYDWEVSGMVSEGRLSLQLNYSGDRYDEASVALFIKHYQESLEGLIAYCSGYEGRLLSVSDLTHRGIAMEALDKLQSSYSLEDIYPLAPLQEGMLFASLMDKESDTYFDQMSCTLKGAMDLDAVKKAMNKLLERYSVLRANFITEEVDSPVQIIHSHKEIDYRYLDIREEISNGDEAAVLEVYRGKDRSEKFDLSGSVLMRLTVLRTGAERYEFIWSFHHILMDGWCVSILINEFGAYYRSLTSGVRIELPEVRPYSDYLKWLSGRNREASSAFWESYLEGYDTQSSLPGRLKLQQNDSVHAASSLLLDEGLTAGLHRLSREYGVTVNTILQAAWGILLSRYNYNNDVVFGSVVSGRPAEVAGIEQMVGLFINTIPVRVQFEGTTRVCDLLQGLQQDSLSAEPYHYQSLSEIQGLSSLGKNLLDHIIVFENYPIADEITGNDEASEGTFHIQKVSMFEQTNYDLSIIVLPGKEMHVNFDFNTSRFSESLIEQVKNQLAFLLEQIISNTEQEVDTISLLKEEEANTQLRIFDNSEVDYPENETLISLFEQQVVKTPNNIAVVLGDESLTYKELDERCNRLAYILQEKGVERDKGVGLLIGRSVDTVIAMLAIMKAGGAYIPIDVDYPSERINYTINDSGISVLLTLSEYAKLVEFEGTCVLLDTVNYATGEVPEVKSSNQPEDLCYVIYTSGTTGKPKGVMVEHRNAVRLFFNNDFQFDFGEDDVWTMFHSHCFDFSVWEMYGALLFGGKLVIIPKETAVDTFAYYEVLRNHKVTILNQTPSAFDNLMEVDTKNELELPALRYVIFGGEALSPGKLKDWKNKYPQVKLINMYGITETTVHVTYKEITSKEIESGRSTIGTPIPTLSLFLFDQKLRPVPQGVIGELYVGGAGVTRGYLNKESLTAGRFIANPYSPGERLYKTGDQARILDSGELEYLGRIDHQVQLRGFRIELGEIEGRLQGYDGITQSYVLLREVSGNASLVCYYTSSGEVSGEALREYLHTVLPDYMVPGYYVSVDSFPLTSNGKLDRNSLPLPESGIEGLYRAPRNEVEELLAGVWCGVLGVDRIGIDDNFFSIGGDSIKSIQISSRMRSHGYDVTVKELFNNPTIASLSVDLRKLTRSISQEAVVGRFDLSPIQQWFISGPVTCKDHFNQSVMLEFTNGISKEAVKGLFEVLLAHHDALRLVYREGEQESMAVGSHSLQIDERDVTDASGLSSYANALQSSFSLTEGPLVKLGLYQMTGGSSHLLISMHHWVIDAVSWRILFEDLGTLYAQYSEGSPLKLPLKTDSYRTWISSLKTYSQGSVYQENLAYWKALLEGTYNWIPVNDVTGANTYQDVKSAQFTLSEGHTGLLLRDSQHAFGTQINDLLLAALMDSFHSVYGMESLCLDLESHGREDIGDVNISRTVGWFTTLYPVVLGYEEDLSRLVRGVKECLRSVPHGGIDYLLGISRGDLYPAGSRLLFNYLGQFDSDSRSDFYGMSAADRGMEVKLSSEREYDWEVSGMVSEGRLSLQLNYSGDRYDEASVALFIKHYQESLEGLIAYCSGYEGRLLSVSDLTHRGIAMEALDKLQSSYSLEDIYPLAPLQEGMLFASLMDKESDTYFDQMSCTLKGAMDLDAVKKAMNKLLERYSVLRANFITEEVDSPVQIIHSHKEIDYRYLDIREEISNGDEAAVLEVYRGKDRSEKFDLSGSVLMRLTVLRTGAERYEFIWSFHHILMDGWCVSILINEFGAYYRSLTSGVRIELPEVRPYSDYLKWLSGRNREASSAFWESYLEGYDTQSSLPGRLKLQQNDSVHAASSLLLDEGLTAGLHRLSREYGVTVNTILQAAWGILLSRYNYNNDVVFGSVVSGRPAEVAGIEQMVGLFINTIPVRVQFEGTTRVCDLLQGLQQDSLSAEPYHYQSLSEIQGLSSLGKNLLDHIIVFENYPIADEITGNDEASEGTFHIQKVSMFEQTNYDLSIIVLPGKEIYVNFEFNTNRFDPVLIEGVKKQLYYLLEQFSKDPALEVDKLSLLRENEVHELKASLGYEERLRPTSKTVITLFEEQVLKTPDNIAVELDDETLTYAQLSNLVDKLTFYLKSNHAIGSGDLVLLHSDRNFDMIISVLAIMKSGAAYIPVETEYAQGRLETILAESKAAYILTHHPHVFDFEANAEILDINEIKTSVNKTGHTEINNYSNADDVAYVMFTSGSTGKPKGVLIGHTSLLDYSITFKETFGIDQNDRIIQQASLTFDTSIEEIFPALTSGARLLIMPERGLNIEYMVAAIYNKKATVLSTIPLVLNELNNFNDRLKSLRVIVSGGDLLLPSHIDHLIGKYKLYNTYGPTESTVCITYNEINGLEQTSYLGKPIPNRKVCILDEKGRLCPIMVPGELYVGGKGLALGYLGNTELTDEKFVSVANNSGERMYKTGDLVRLLPSGGIEFMGRTDDQVKIRGFRIEVGEIEAHLHKNRNISKCAVAVKEINNEKQIVAYFESNKEVASVELRNYLAKKLPDFMIPGFFMAMDELPVTTSGKIDKKKLPLPEVKISEFHQEATTGIEKELVKIWASLLNLSVDVIGVNRNFFEIGGNSLKIVKLRSLIQEHLNIEVSIPDLFTYPTISSLVKYLEEGDENEQLLEKKAEEEASEMKDLLDIFQ